MAVGTQPPLFLCFVESHFARQHGTVIDLAVHPVSVSATWHRYRHRRPELRPGAMKATAKTWYYIDFQRTIDVIKWRMYKIRKVIDDKLRNVRRPCIPVQLPKSRLS